ncbi:MAG: hypothetical protein FD165_1935 [Gammaproteobacteria bacterium]|nr:MAG: hypothetical protein FD165_1935 [Gammaproteobacteria bacterium]TND04507.1 MAG: hypothetical protein FD120_1621 [Gammaproteobacteria bacterium]
MNKLVYSIILAVFFSSYLASGIHRAFNLVPEILSGIVLVVILARIATYRSLCLSPKYLVLGVLAVLHAVSGMILNTVDPGTIVTGLRPYLKWIPLFLLPAVYRFSEQEISGQIKLILILGLMQSPLAFFQRFVQYRDAATGDFVTGTLGESASGVLSIFLLSVIAVVIAFYVRGRLRFPQMLLLTLALFLPTTINETKVTLLLLPLAIVVPYIVASNRLSMAQLVVIPVLGALLTTGFVVIYDYAGSMWGARGISEFVDKEADSYLYSESDATRENLLEKNRIGSGLQLPEELITPDEGGGRVEKLLLPLKNLSDNPLRLWVGLGVGNASPSIINVFSGTYSGRIGKISSETLSSFLLWEVGVGGIIILFTFLIILMYDTYKIGKEKNTLGVLAAGWFGVLVIVLLTVPYLNLFYANVLVFLFAYISGYISAERRWAQYNPVRTTLHS